MTSKAPSSHPSKVMADMADDPNYPSYFPPRDGEVTTIGAFWRHSDLLGVLETELQMAQVENNQDHQTSVPFPVFGVASFLARGLRFFVHDHPALDFGGKAVSDGSLVFIPRRMIETLNNLSFPPSEKGQRMHLLTWMAQASVACAHHTLGVKGETASIIPLSTGLLDMSDLLPKALDPRTCVKFIAPSELQGALKQAYASAASPLVIDELCGQVPPMDDTRDIARTRSRVCDALGQARIALDQLVNDRFGSTGGLIQAAEMDGVNPAPRVRRGWTAAPDLLAHERALGVMEKAAKSLGAEPYHPIEVAALNQHVFFYGADALYSLHVYANNMMQDPQTHWGEMLELIKGYGVELPVPALIHISRSKKTEGTTGSANMLKHFMENPNATRDTRDIFVEGVTSNLWLGGCSEAIKSQLYLRDIAAASLLGKQVHQHARKIFDASTSKEIFAAAFRVGGDALCLDKDDGRVLMKTLREVARQADIKLASEDEVAFQYGNLVCVRQFLDDLTTDQLSRGLLLAAQNRHAIALITDILAIDGVVADAVDEKGHTVAHLLLDHTHHSKSTALVPVIVKLLELGMDPQATVEGLRAGERAGEQPLAGWGVMNQAIVQWEHKHLLEQTHKVAAARPRAGRL